MTRPRERNDDDRAVGRETRDATRCARRRNECMWVYELLSIKRDARERERRERRERTGGNGREREGVCGEK
jgi:hypothetical protein